MIKHIFCDLDGTLLKDFSKIDEKDIKALQNAQEQGVKVSIATGRLDYEIKRLMHEYQLHGFRVSQNGGVVFNDDNQIVHKVSLTSDEIKLIIESLKGFNILIFFQTVDEYIVEKRVPLIVDFEKKQSLIKYNENVNIMTELDLHDIISISIWAEKDENMNIKLKLDQILPENLETYISSEYTIDITNERNSKGNAIKHLSELHKINLEEVAVIGDSQNDVSMFNITQNSFVMTNARDEVKQHAKYEVDSVKDAVEIILKD